MGNVRHFHGQTIQNRGMLSLAFLIGMVTRVCVPDFEWIRQSKYWGPILTFKGAQLRYYEINTYECYIVAFRASTRTSLSLGPSQLDISC